jgi:2',3'-cyclic-nucleotide 2'-phosphodiesterase (5'-nucleotidase family)
LNAKRIMALLLIVTLICTAFTGTVLAHSQVKEDKGLFTDFSKKDYGYNEVASLVSRGYITGNADGSFQPNHSLTRAEAESLVESVVGENLADSKESASFTRGDVASLLVTAFSLEGNSTTDFKDIANSPFKADVEILFSNGITAGKSKTNFGVNEEITRRDFAILLYRVLAKLPKGKQITLIHDTHFHGNFGDPKKAKNVANYFGLINQIRAEKKHSLMLGNGDDLASSILSSIFRGEHIIDAFNAGGLDVNTFGNHDFDMGPEVLAEMVKKSKFNWVSANVVDKRSNEVFAKEEGANSFVIKNLNGVKVGITGLINEEAPEITSMGENAIVLSPVNAMNAIIPKMKNAGADIIVVLSHLSSPVAEDLAAKVNGIDVILGDHAGYSYEQPTIVNNTILSFVGDEFTHLGVLTLSIEGTEIKDFGFIRYTLEEEVEKEGFQSDAKVQTVMDTYTSKLDEELNVVIGQNLTVLDTQKSTVRTQEAAIGNYIADTLKAYTNSDVALVNGGGIRSDLVYEPGDITKKMVQSILPFTNYVVKLEVTGDQIVKALENGVSQIENGAGRFAQVSGITFSFNATLPAGERVSEVKVNGEAIDLTKKYTLATADFLANGGDGYESFVDAPKLLDKDAGPLLSQLIMETIAAEKTIAPEVEGRIVEVK